MSILRPETLAVLKDVRSLRPMFPNMIAAELFDAEHTRGDLTVLPTTMGGYVVFDKLAPNGRGVRARCANLEQAHSELERISKGLKADTESGHKPEATYETRERTPAKPGVTAGETAATHRRAEAARPAHNREVPRSNRGGATGAKRAQGGR